MKIQSPFTPLLSGGVVMLCEQEPLVSYDVTSETAGGHIPAPAQEKLFIPSNDRLQSGRALYDYE